jgi:hypothetical protein
MRMNIYYNETNPDVGVLIWRPVALPAPSYWAKSWET